MSEIYLWNPRGRVIKVAASEVSNLLGQGYLQPTERELRRIQEGSLIYSQVYDKGLEASQRRREPPIEKIEIRQHGDLIKTELI